MQKISLTGIEESARSVQPGKIYSVTGATRIKTVRNRMGALFAVLLLAVSGVFLAFPANVAHAETLGYPWPTDTQAPCKYGAAGGSDCHNTAEGMSWDKYNWGVYDSNGTFQPFRNNGYEYRNCTDYAQWRITELGGSVPFTLHSGGQWYDNASANQRSSTPQAGFAAVKPATYDSNGNLTSYGHVAVVESVNTDGTITISEYNGSGTGFGRTQTKTASSMGFTEFVDFGATVPSGGGTTAGTDTIGSFDPSTATFYLRNNNTPGSADATAQFGAGGWIPVVGDWNGNGSDTIGSFDPSTATFYLRNSNTPGSADTVVQFGAGGWKPLVGNWDGIGADGIGSYDPTTATFYLKNTNTPGSADAVIQFGAGGWIPVVGDWDGNGTTTIGSFDPSTATFYLRNSNTPGSADAVIQFGAGGWTPVVGDWNGDGSTTIGSFDPTTATFYLRNDNTPGSADATAQFGAGGWIPVVGDWNGQ